MVALSPLAGAGWQFFDSNGVPLAGGKLYTYAAGTTTPAATYTSSSGVTPHANPIILDSAGRIPGGEVWISNTAAYKFVLETALSVLIGTYDDLSVANAGDIGLTPFGYTTATDVQTAFNDLGGNDGADFVGFIQPEAGAAPRSALAKLRDFIAPQDFGAVGDGVTDDVGAFFDAGSTGKTIRVPSGDYLIGSSTTISSQIEFDAGAKLLIGNGVTVAFTGQVVSGPYQIFQCTGTGAVTFNEAKTSEGYPEWWGALVNNAGAAAANRIAINACITALPRTKLQPADYWTSDYIHLAISHRELIGQGYPYNGSTADVVSRIVVNNGTTDAIRVGPNVAPPAVNQFPQGLRVMNITTDRAVAPVVSSDCTGIRVQYVLYAQFENVMARQCIYGWRFNGAVYTKVRDCQAFRSIAGTGGPDKYYGFFADGSISIGLAGGNASLYLEGCNSNVGGISITNSSGVYADLAFTDLFIYEFESVRHNIGINIQGNGAGTYTPYSNLDLQIRNPVIDAYEQFGIFFKNVNDNGACEVIGGYTAPAGGGTASCGIIISDCVGSVAIHGTQMIMPQSAATNGIIIENSANAVIDRAQILDCRGTPMTVNNSVSCDVRPVIKNYLEYTAQALLVMGATTGCYIQPIINGKANIYSTGINVGGTADVRNEYNCTLVNSDCLIGGRAKKLVRNGVNIIATGLSGTNLVSGVMT